MRYFDRLLNSSVAMQKAQAGAHLPTLFMEGNLTQTQNRYLAHEGNASLAMGASIDLYDGGRIEAELSKERSKQRQLVLQKEKLIEDVKYEVEDSLYSFKNASEKVTVARVALAQSQENVRFFRAKFNVGSANSSEVLEAISAQTAAQTNYYSSDYEVKRNYAKLMYATGIDLALLYERLENNDGK